MDVNNDIIYGIPVFEKRHYHLIWLPTLYLMRGLPYILLFFTSIVFYSQLRVDTSYITLSTSWFIVPFILRPFLGRLVLSFESKRYWILLCEFIIGMSLFGIALSIPLKQWYAVSYAFFCIIGIAAAIHDIAIERFYKRSANIKRKSAFVGLRSFFYLLSVVVGFAMPIIFVGNLEVMDRLIRTPWIKVFNLLGIFSLLMMVYHAIFLPPAYVHSNMPLVNGLTIKWIKDIVEGQKKRPYFQNHFIFLLCFMLPNFMTLRTLTAFLLDVPSGGGLAFSPQEVGYIQGTIGLFAFILGLVVGNNGVKTYGLYRLRWPMFLALFLPKILFVYLSFSYNHSIEIASIAVFLDHFGLGVGANMYALPLLYFTNAKHPTFTYAMGASVFGASILMASLLTGFLQEYFSYRQVFIFIIFTNLISMLILKFQNFDEGLDNKFKNFTIKRKMDIL